MKPLTYLACPYSHTDPAVRQDRYRAANEATAALIRTYRWNVFSPITHSHPLALLGLDGDWSYWEHIDTDYLKMSCRMVILTLPGWKESVGIRHERALAKQYGAELMFMSRPIEHVEVCPGEMPVRRIAFQLDNLPRWESDFNPVIYL